MVDEHNYNTPGWFIYNQDYYDHYDRHKSKVYLGEYAAHAPGRPSNIETGLAAALFPDFGRAQRRCGEHDIIRSALGQGRAYAMEAGFDLLQQHGSETHCGLLRAANVRAACRK